MIEQKTVVVVEKNDRQYCMICDNESPLNEIYDVLVEMQCQIFAVIKKCEFNSKLAEDKPVEEVPQVTNV